MVREQNHLQPTRPIELNYLVIGHITADQTPSGIRLGGTAAFSGLTARALGMKAGIITSFAPTLDDSPIQPLWTLNKQSENSTTFKNISDGTTRTQYLYHVAAPLGLADLPSFSSPPDILHLGPVANEVDVSILDRFPTSLKCLTPQGWMRATDSNHQVSACEWSQSEAVLPKADIAVISHEDVLMQEDRIASMASAIPVFVVTEGKLGARVYWNSDARFINAPEVKYVDDTGAGDIFATAFFYRYFFTKDPWEAGRFAVRLASQSVTRKHLESIPTPEEISAAKMQLIGK